MCGVLFKTQSKSRNKMILLINTNTKVKEVGGQGMFHPRERKGLRLEAVGFLMCPVMMSRTQVLTG